MLTLVDESLVSLVSSDYLVVKQLDTGSPRSASLDMNGNIWVADYGSGLVTKQGGDLVEDYSQWSKFDQCFFHGCLRKYTLCCPGGCNRVMEQPV